MKLSTKMLIVAVVFAVPALFLGHVLWPDPLEHALAPSASQLPFFIFLSVLEAAAFGVGIAFIIFGWPLLQKVTTDKREKTLLFLATAWFLISWWPHDNMHRHNGGDLAGLLQIEYLFHFTLIVAAMIIARQLWKMITKAEQVSEY